MGRIVTVRELSLSRTLVIKEPLLEKAEDWEDRIRIFARFEREARLTACLNHPNIVAVTDVGRWPWGTPFYAMKEVPNSSTLREKLEAAHTIPERLALLPHIIDAAQAVSYAHRQGVMHRDLTPRNILIGRFGETVVIDWGLGKRLTDTNTEVEETDTLRSTGDEQLTETGYINGTPPYMSPEQARGDDVDVRADVYSLGAMLYHLMTGVAPYADRQAPHGASCGRGTFVCDQVRNLPPTPARELEPRIPPALATIIEKAMAREPGERYQSAAELATELQTFQSGELVRAHTYTLWDRLGRRMKKHRAVVAIAMAAFVAFSVQGFLSYLQIKKQKANAVQNAQQAIEAAQEAERNRKSAMEATQEAERNRKSAIEAAEKAEQSKKRAEENAQRAGENERKSQRAFRALAKKQVELAQALTAAERARDEAARSKNELSANLSNEQKRSERLLQTVGDISQSWRPDGNEDSSPGGDVIAAAEKAFNDGNEKTHDGLFLDALHEYRHALATSDHPAAHANLGIILSVLDRPREAYRHLRSASQRGERTLDQDVLDNIRRRLAIARASISELVIECADDMVVMVDGERRCSSPGEERRILAPGNHEIVASRPGRPEVRRPVRLSPGMRTAVDLEPLATRRWPRWKPWAVTGAGAALTLVGGALYARGESILSGLEPGYDPHAEATEARGRRYTVVGISSIVVGGASFLTGVALGYLNREKHQYTYSIEDRRGLTIEPIVRSGVGAPALGLSISGRLK